MFVELGQDRKVAALTQIFMCTFFIGEFMNDFKYMSIALKEAKKAYELKEIPVGAVIVKDNKVIAKAHNMKENKNSVISHAEILAINKASKKLNNWRLNGCTIYVTLFPCPMCASAINQSRIDNIVYGTIPKYANKKLVNTILKDNNYGNITSIKGNILEEQSLELLQKFFQKKR